MRRISPLTSIMVAFWWAHMEHPGEAIQSMKIQFLPPLKNPHKYRYVLDGREVPLAELVKDRWPDGYR